MRSILMCPKYAWAGDYGLLAKIEGDTEYLATAGETYVIPTKPDNINPDVLVNGTTQTILKVLQAQTIVKKRDWVVVLGFQKSVSNNFRECLQPRYYKQLYALVFKYKRITPRSYITNLESKWVILDEL